VVVVFMLVARPVDGVPVRASGPAGEVVLREMLFMCWTRETA
jgi:hypothetical protein